MTEEQQQQTQEPIERAPGETTPIEQPTTETATVETPPKETPAPQTRSTSSLESEIAALERSLAAEHRRVESLASTLAQVSTGLEETRGQLTLTMELWQEQIGQVDAATQALVDSAAALVKLHKLQTAPKA